jgi:DNA-binding NarL/FixJ family response regulator
MIQVLLADDHQVVREGTRRFVERAEDMTVIGETGDGQEAVQLANHLQPDIVVMDVRMPGLNGLEATRRIKAQHPHIHVLILSAYEDDQYVFPLLDAGANGYLLKTTSGAEVVRAIRTVCRGEKVLDPHITTKVVSRLTAPQPTYRSEEMVESLTEREMEVLRAVAGGKSNKEVAEVLFLSVYTVQVHLRNVFAKLGVGNRTEAVTYALTQGWINLQDLQDGEER